MKPELAKEYAMQQLTGYQEAWSGFPIENLISSMGLTEEEWNDIKPSCQWLSVELMKDIDDYFKEEE